MNIDFKPNIKQHTAWLYLNDKTTTHLLFGGAMGGGKSYLGCMWIFISCLTYPRTRWLIGRSRLKSIKETTLATFLDILRKYDFFDKVLYNSMSNKLIFPNGSEVILMDLYPYPADPLFTRFGSLEISGAFIDELAEIKEEAFEIISTRIRYKLLEYNLTPKILSASNPTMGWPKKKFYDPWVKKDESKNVKFVQAFMEDNIYLADSYRKSLEENLSHKNKKRLLYGDWEFGDEDYNLFKNDDIMECFFNKLIDQDQETYLSADIANIGKDRTVLTIWKGLEIVDIEIINRNNTPEIINRINDLKRIYNIKNTNIVIDADGLGVGVADYFPSCFQFKGNSKALNGENYKNLKTQCIFYLSDYVRRHDIKFLYKYKDEIISELSVFRISDLEKEQVELENKAKMKNLLGKSPDIADTLYMRMVFNIKKYFTYI